MAGDDVPLGSIALAMARSGLPVFPCLPGQKRPATRDGLKSATRDPALIRRWWAANPVFNIGIATGDLVVIDCDAGKPWPREGRPPVGVNDGADLLVAIADSHGVTDGDWLFGTWSVRTPSGGMHLYYSVPAGVEVRNSAGQIAPWIDVRGRGGYVIGPWSSLPNGDYIPVTGWDHLVHACSDLTSITDASMTAIHGRPLPLPAWMRGLITPTPVIESDPFTRLLAALDVAPTGRSYADAALAGEVERVRLAPTGQRNHTLNRAAFSLGQLVAAGTLLLDVVEVELRAAALACGLPSGEADQTIRSGIAGGTRNPRQVVLP
jgi:hypothetical protein